MLKFFRAGGELLRKSYLVVVPAIVFVAISSLIDTGTPTLTQTHGVAEQAAAFFLQPTVFLLLLGVLVIDAVATLFMTADVYFAWKGRSSRFFVILRSFSFENWFSYIVFSIFWYGFFSFFGLGFMYLGDLFIPAFYPRVIIIGIVALLSFPLFFAGISVSAFALIFKRDVGISVVKTSRYFLDHLPQVYGFYIIRSFLDIGLTFCIPLFFVFLFKNEILGFFATVILTAAFLTFTRAASISFKLDLIKPLLRKNIS